ncbi:MAG: nitrogen fixation protein [Leptolyngbya sp. UWPOB_LEPTO1]|uniref:NifB/NifX family molybdenum-iron cluster-binding protein n=1 Tax=Leptolyngbya sp. UWPOB_LEPTO1 TaxID=2815653 RepID=UPI001ACBBCB8|nr:NifB/NifX family molybdenum-iron cluster-binding protein [Leptolyngbya sp. UWPOB_LEPTO1]MBN8563636.1 nitrogen fixation protein [Leptolyngbya sp. UWPOB_LEPTO1]
MKIAVSSQNQTNVTAHLGHCQKFWIYDVDNGTIQNKELLQLTKDQSFHESSPKDPHSLDTVQVLISGSMGRGLVRRLESKGIQPIITPETDLDAAITAYLTGSLAILTSEEVEHHHDHEQGHDPEGECGCNQA